MKYIGTSLLILLASFVGFNLLVIISSYFIDDKREYDKNSRYYRFLLNSSTGLWLKILRIKLHINGAENVPENGRFFLVSNHRSKFDPIVTWYALRDKDLAFITKPENFNVPFFGRIIRKCAFMGIDREDARNAIKTVNKAARLLSEDEVSVAAYPEGTRSFDCTLLPFHNGIFLIAKKARVPTVVLVVRGTEDIHKRVIKHRTDVYLDFVSVVRPDEYERVNTNELGAKIRKIYEETLGGMSNEQVHDPLQPESEQRAG